MRGVAPKMTAAARAAARSVRPGRVLGTPWHRLLIVAGDRPHLKVIVVLAAVLGLDGADKAAVSATTGQLERAFDIGNTEVGIIVSVVSLSSAVLTLPFGVLIDRVTRTRLLAWSAVGWGIAMLVSGAAQSYLWLLLARAGLGATTAAAVPAIASLTGDYFPAASRARVYGLILCGELVGTGFGFILAGQLAAAVSWRAAFWVLLVPAVAVVIAVGRLREPARGAQKSLDTGMAPAGESDLATRAASRTHVAPVRGKVIRGDPATASTWWVVRHVLSIPTNVLLIVTSTFGYFFFAGVRAFAVLFGIRHYGLDQRSAILVIVVIGLGALVGMLVGGRVADRWLARGRLNARIWVPIVSVFAAVVLLAPGFVTSSLLVGIPLMTIGAGFLGAPNPPLDAARLDIMPPALWGRAEGVRTILRTLGEAAAPTLFGYVSERVVAVGGSPLADTFVLFLVPLAAAGFIALPALRTYPRDVVAAVASRETG